MSVSAPNEKKNHKSSTSSKTNSSVRNQSSISSFFSKRSISSPNSKNATEIHRKRNETRVGSQKTHEIIDTIIIQSEDTNDEETIRANSVSPTGSLNSVIDCSPDVFSSKKVEAEYVNSSCAVKRNLMNESNNHKSSSQFNYSNIRSGSQDGIRKSGISDENKRKIEDSHDTNDSDDVFIPNPRKKVSKDSALADELAVNFDKTDKGKASNRNEVAEDECSGDIFDVEEFVGLNDGKNSSPAKVNDCSSKYNDDPIPVATDASPRYIVSPPRYELDYADFAEKRQNVKTPPKTTSLSNNTSAINTDRVEQSPSAIESPEISSQFFAKRKSIGFTFKRKTSFDKSNVDFGKPVENNYANSRRLPEPDTNSRRSPEPPAEPLVNHFSFAAQSTASRGSLSKSQEKKSFESFSELCNSGVTKRKSNRLTDDSPTNTVQPSVPTSTKTKATSVLYNDTLNSNLCNESEVQSSPAELPAWLDKISKASKPVCRKQESEGLLMDLKSFQECEQEILDKVFNWFTSIPNNIAQQLSFVGSDPTVLTKLKMFRQRNKAKVRQVESALKQIRSDSSNFDAVESNVKSNEHKELLHSKVSTVKTSASKRTSIDEDRAKASLAKWQQDNLAKSNEETFTSAGSFESDDDDLIIARPRSLQRSSLPVSSPAKKKPKLASQKDPPKFSSPLKTSTKHLLERPSPQKSPTKNRARNGPSNTSRTLPTNSSAHDLACLSSDDEFDALFEDIYEAELLNSKHMSDDIDTSSQQSNLDSSKSSPPSTSKSSFKFKSRISSSNQPVTSTFSDDSNSSCNLSSNRNNNSEKYHINNANRNGSTLYCDKSNSISNFDSSSNLSTNSSSYSNNNFASGTSRLDFNSSSISGNVQRVPNSTAQSVPDNLSNLTNLNSDANSSSSNFKSPGAGTFKFKKPVYQSLQETLTKPSVGSGSPSSSLPNSSRSWSLL